MHIQTQYFAQFQVVCRSLESIYRSTDAGKEILSKIKKKKVILSIGAALKVWEEIIIKVQKLELQLLANQR